MLLNYKICVAVCSALMIDACAPDVADCPEQHAVDWSLASHTEDEGYGYETLFPSDAVQRLDLTICPAWHWQMERELKDALGAFGAANKPSPFRPQPQPGEDGGAPPMGLEQDPSFVPATVSFQGRSWPYVGARFKGNSSLVTSWMTGVAKLPLRLDFDEFEDDYPETHDQRFWGFKHLVLTPPGDFDPSMLRNALANEILDSYGLPAPRTVPCEVWVDTGDGPVYWGLYTLLEDPADEPFLERNWGSHDGNAYKPEEDCADWTCFDEGAFIKKNNEEQADWTDVQAAVAVLLDDSSMDEAWQSSFDALFDTDSFMRWLAVNTAMGNWDSYGNLAHNYYLYGDPAAHGQLSWIPWDHNMALQEGQMEILSMGLDEVGEAWPLIRRLMDHPTTATRYWEAVARFDEGLLRPDLFYKRAVILHAVIAEAVAAEQAPYTHLQNPADFDISITGPGGLQSWIRTRQDLWQAWLDEQ